MPIAAAAPALIVVVVLALLLAVLLINAQLYTNGRQARDFAANLPLLSAPLVTAIDAILAFDVHAAIAMDTVVGNFLLDAIQAFGRLVVACFNAAGAVILTLIHDTAAKVVVAYSVALHLRDAVVPALASRVADLERLEGAVSSAIRSAIGVAVATAVAGLRLEIAPIRIQAATSADTINTYRPIWEQLAAVPGGAAHTLLLTAAGLAALSARVATLEGELADTRSGVSALERQLAAARATLGQLAALGVISVAGALVIENLLRIGRNPCEPCAGVNLNDFEARLASVELGNL